MFAINPFDFIRSSLYNSDSLLSRASKMERYEEVLVALRRLIRATDLHSRYLNKTSGITAPQLLVMQVLRNLGPQISSTIAKEVNLSQATVTNILDRLEQRDLIERNRSTEDKRKVFVSLTDQGLERIKNAPLPLQEYFVRQFKELPEWEQTMILSSLQRLAGMMDAQQIDASPVLEVGDIDRAVGEPFTRPGFGTDKSS